LALHGESGCETDCWNSRGEAIRIGGEDSGDEKVGRWGWTWLLAPPPGRPNENDGGVWGITVYIAIRCSAAGMRELEALGESGGEGWG